MRFFYGFQYEDGRGTTCGTPNSRTGRMSAAGWLVVFATKKDQQSWIAENDRRESVTAKEARSLCSGLSESEYQEYLQDLKQEFSIEIE